MLSGSISGGPVKPPLIQSAKSLYSQSPNSLFLTLCYLHLAVNFEDGFYIGELVVIMDVETVKNSYMVPKKISTATNH
jgi:hypothetical protein